MASINTKDLEKARIAETIPLDSAVNMPLAKILKPIKNSAMVHILFPATASPYTGLSGRAKTETRGFDNTKEATTVIIEIAPITFRLMETSFFNFP